MPAAIIRRPPRRPLKATQGRRATRGVSINVELPTSEGLARLGPDKDGAGIEDAMQGLQSAIVEAKDARKRFRSTPQFAPAGQSTQMIVGADQASGVTIVARASALYGQYRLRRVYCSAFSPIPDASAVLPLKRPPLIREHRLYQSDWLMRFYGFQPDDLAGAADADGMLPLDIDPKLAWALKFRGAFPVNVNRASREELLRVPGLGARAVGAILASRRHRQLRLDDLAKLTTSLTKIRPFIIAADWRPLLLTDRADLRALVAKPRAEQLELFAARCSGHDHRRAAGRYRRSRGSAFRWPRRAAAAPAYGGGGLRQRRKPRGSSMTCGNLRITPGHWLRIAPFLDALFLRSMDAAARSHPGPPDTI